MTNIKDLKISKTVADENDWLILQAESGETYRIRKADFLSQGTEQEQKQNIFYPNNGQGVFYFIGTNGGTWSNPYTSDALISLTASSIFNEYGYGNIANLVGRNNQAFATNNIANSWIRIDLKNNKLKITRYTLQAQNDSNSNPRNWTLKGSNDLINWVSLDVVVNQSNFNSLSVYVSPEIESNTAYQYFEFTMNGSTNSGNYYFILGEIELYGELYQ